MTLYTRCSEDTPEAVKFANPSGYVYAIPRAYSEAEMAVIQAEAECYALMEITYEESSRFHGPFSDPTYREWSSSKELPMEVERLMVSEDGHLIGYATEQEWIYRHNREGNSRDARPLLLGIDGEPSRTYTLNDTTLYGHDGEEDCDETVRKCRLIKRSELSSAPLT